MTALRLLALTASLFAAVTPVSAEYYANEKSSNDPNSALYIALAHQFAPLAELFGCNFSWANANDASSVQLEFVPHGQDVRTWTRMVTINTLRLPREDEKRLALLKDLQAMMLERYRTAGRVLDTEEGVDETGAPTLFVEYEIGSGAAKEHNAAMIMKLTAGMAGIVQIQSRGTPLPRIDADKMKRLAKIRPV